MGLDLDVELSLEERLEDSVIVSVFLSPTDGATPLDGVALRLRDRHGEGLGPRVLLPISGTLGRVMRTTVALETEDGEDIPTGASVQVVAWHGHEQREALMPTDPMTALEVHVRGTTAWVLHDGDRMLEPLLPEERAVWAEEYPWIDEPRVPPVAKAELGVVDHEPDTDEEVDAFAEEMGLDEESAEWLKDLMSE